MIGAREATQRTSRSLEAKYDQIRQIWLVNTKQDNLFGLAEYKCPKNILEYKNIIKTEHHSAKPTPHHHKKSNSCRFKQTYLDEVLKDKRSIPGPWTYKIMPDIEPAEHTNGYPYYKAKVGDLSEQRWTDALALKKAGVKDKKRPEKSHSMLRGFLFPKHIRELSLRHRRSRSTDKSTPKSTSRKQRKSAQKMHCDLGRSWTRPLPTPISAKDPTDTKK